MRVGQPGAVRNGELQHVPTDAALQLRRGAGRDDQAAVDDHDLVGQLVGLVQVLGRQQQCRAPGDQRADDVPHPQPGPRVQAGGRLVQEQDLGPADQARGQVQTAMHAAGEALGGPVGRLGQVELLQQLGGANAGTRAGPGGTGAR